MSLPNKITIFRILLAPAIVAALVYYHPERDWLRYLAFGLFVIGVISDAVDGFLARLHHQQTELGTLLDPIADKALILSTLISCSVIHGLPAWMRIPAWFNLIVISRDVVLVAGTAVVFAITGRWSIRPSPVGKSTTVAQMLVVSAVLLGSPPSITNPLLILAAALTAVSAAGYVRAGIRALG
jgi:CDP-diacylglycerol--glycerol-3-phosphate 3-phosphatidyltransferase